MQFDNQERDALEVPFTVEEFVAALETCASHRSPGLDGLPYEFYQKVGPIIAPSMIQVYQQQLDAGLMAPSFRQGVTRLLSKVAHPQVPKVTELRPITLTNSDYKLQSKMLGARMVKVLPKVLGNSGQLCSTLPKNILCGVSELISTIDYVNLKKLSAFVVSFDIMKAYDKTCVPFVCQVLESMNFGQIFISWVRAMHKNITTRFILGSMTKEIELLLSIRQGDPQAMNLFLVNMQPFLAYLHRVLSGIAIGGLQQKDTDYVDDVNVISTDTGDLLKLDQAFLDFESFSGTVLNRSHKSKIMGLGEWRDRVNWPLPWLRNCTSLKIFGVHICQDYLATLHTSWDHCLTGFNNCLLSWSSRNLPTLQQRVFVMGTFAMSKLWYLGQVLPLPKKWLTKMEKRVRSFLWLGRLEHLSLDELYAPVTLGGLGLVSIGAKCDALFIKQMCRVLASGGQTRAHYKYWLGLSLRDTFPEMAGGPNSECLTPYWRHCSSLIKEAVDLGLVDPTSLGRVKTKFIYKELISTPPPPKVTYKFTRVEWMVAWKRLDSPVLDGKGRDLFFSFLNNIYPTKERLLRMNQHPTGFCEFCRGVTEDVLHLLTDCAKSRNLWVFVKNIIVTILPPNSNFLLVDNFSIIMLNFAKFNRENAILFLLSNYALFLHSMRTQKENPSINKLKGFLSFSMSLHKKKKLPPLGEIAALS